MSFSQHSKPNSLFLSLSWFFQARMTQKSLSYIFLSSKQTFLYICFWWLLFKISTIAPVVSFYYISMWWWWYAWHLCTLIYMHNGGVNVFCLTLSDFNSTITHNSAVTCSYQMFIILSCTIAVGTNLSQFICIGRFTAVSFQVLGHMKTILVLIMGFFFFGKEGLNLHVVLGMIIAVVGMIWYGNASSKPGGKERRSYSLPTSRQQKHSGLSESTELDGKV